MSDKSVNEIREQCEQRVAEEKQALGIKPPVNEPISDKFMERCIWEDQDGDADLFRRIHEGRVVFDERENCWYVWTGHFWERFRNERILIKIRDLVKEYTRMQFRVAKDIKQTSDDDDIKSLKRREMMFKNRANALRKITRKRSIISLAKILPEMLFDNDWDHRPMKLACLNGVLNLNTFELEDGQAKDYIRTACPVEYDPDAKAPAWETFMLEIFNGDAEVVEYIQKILGYSVTGLGNINRFYVLYGEHGQNGKSTMLETLFKVLGDIASPIQSEMLLDRDVPKNPDAPSASLYDLYGKRLVWGSETDDGRRFSASQVKFLSGADSIWCRAPHAPEPIKFPPSHCLFLLTNHFPGVSANEDAFWSRCRIIDFPLSFVEKPVQSHERPFDPQLKVKLEEELSGILTWIIQGCQKWQAADCRLEMPKAVREATYGERERMDICLKFYKECCVQGDDYQVGATDLYNCFNWWAVTNGHQSKGKAWKQARFGREMTSFVKRTSGITKSDKSYKFIHYLGFSVTQEVWDAAIGEGSSDSSAKGRKL